MAEARSYESKHGAGKMRGGPQKIGLSMIYDPHTLEGKYISIVGYTNSILQQFKKENCSFLVALEYTYQGKREFKTAILASFAANDNANYAVYCPNIYIKYSEAVFAQVLQALQKIETVPVEYGRARL